MLCTSQEQEIRDTYFKSRFITPTHFSVALNRWSPAISWRESLIVLTLFLMLFQGLLRTATQAVLPNSDMIIDLIILLLP